MYTFKYKYAMYSDMEKIHWGQSAEGHDNVSDDWVQGMLDL